jgi:hypothetical protein
MAPSRDPSDDVVRIDRHDGAAAPSRDPSDDVVRIDRHDGAAARSHEPNDGVLRIDCDDCAMQGTDCCTDCLVTFICSREPGEAVVVDVAEARALRMLSEAGLLPASRHVRRTG